MKHYFRLSLHIVCFLFIGAKTLLGQFPGYYVQHFNSENGLPNTIKGMVRDENDFVWLATESGLVRFDGSRFKMFDRSESGESVSRLHDIGLTDDGKVFVVAEGKRFYYITPSNTLKQINPAQLAGVGQRHTLRILQAARVNERCKVKNRDGLMPEWALPVVTNTRSYINSLIKTAGYYYYLNRHNQLVVADTGLNNFHLVQLSIRENSRKEFLRGDTVAIELIQQNDDLFIRYTDTIYALHPSPDFKQAHLDALLPAGNISNVMGVLALQGDNMTIVGTTDDGIHLFQKQPFTTVVKNNQVGNVLYAQAPFGPDGSLTAAGVLFPGKFIRFPVSHDVTNILKTREGNYYLNKRDRGVFRINELDSNLKVIREIPFIKNATRCFQQLKDGSIWFSTDSLFLAKIENDRIQWIKRPDRLPAAFGISVFLEAGTLQFWTGGNQGLAKIDLASNEVFLVPELQNIQVRTLYLDQRGTLWIGTYGNGYYAWYKNRLVKFPLDHNRYLAYAHVFMPDRSGRLWISTNQGLFAFSVQDLYRYLSLEQQPPYYQYFDHTAGFQTNEFNGGCTPAGIQLGNGKFSLPSLKGLVQFYPDSISAVFPEAGIFVDHILADTLLIATTGNDIRIPANTRRLKIFISSPYFGNRYNQSIEYSIDKEGETWYALGDDQVIELNNLDKGNYRILLRKQAGYGQNNVITRAIAFTVTPRFYETLFFKILAVVIAGLLLYLIFRLRTRYLERQKKKLEAEVLEKTKEQYALINNLETVVAELEQSRDDLQKNMQFKETLAMIITHDLQSPLRFLSTAMDRMYEKIDGSDPAIQELGSELKKTSANIYHFVEDFGTWIRKVNTDDHKNEEPVNIRQLFDELEAFFKEQQKAKGNRISFEAPEGVYICSDYQLLKIILRNIIDNANKHTRNGTISVQLLATKETAVIKVGDTGTGMKADTLNRLLHQAKKQSSFRYARNADGIGFGYRFVTDFCRMLNISLHIESEISRGTTVTFFNFKLQKPAAAPIASRFNTGIYD